ncbi:MAG: sigma-70 family RNA polymerase sigma factor [Pegethrix bostrychoides GSE-TBD4-15B]|uniref:Sigma-70 family RNA polymerase sigma factor n=1 Tax=Pegethrix bostrychoides GSE-TBD4-15B TaxID=2839662 RepID=A0A951P7T6_9CYAN|nr:sigma-70 family RNA polymerase sigma factor [Pegethrix bostrychoides GSE-TBD4-15B]
MHPEQAGHTREFLLSQTDAELYLALKAGHTAALGILYDRHAGLVYSLALRVLSQPQEAEDLTQDIFVNLSKSTAYEPRRASLRTFLAILTRSRARDRLRSRGTATAFLERWRANKSHDMTASSAFEEILHAEQAQELQAALAQLPEQEQETLRLAYYEGLSQSTIAERLNLPLGTVKSQSRRGLLKLRQTLKNDS